MTKRARPAAEVTERTERRPARELTDAELEAETERAFRELFDRWAERDERRKREVSR